MKVAIAVFLEDGDDIPTAVQIGNVILKAGDEPPRIHDMPFAVALSDLNDVAACICGSTGKLYKSEIEPVEPA